MRQTVDLGTRAHQVRRQEPIVVELGAIELYRHNTKRVRQDSLFHAQKEKNTTVDTAAVSAERMERLDIRAKHEAVAQKSATKKAQKARRKSEEVLRIERRAARKRVCK